MKRKLLFAMLCIVSVLGLKAQTWTAPTIQGEDPVTGTQYKVMNVGSGMFLDMGKAWFNWSTTAILSNSGTNFTLTADGDNWKFVRTGNQGVFTSGNGISGDAMHVDNTPNAYGITKLPNGYYHVHDAGGNASSTCWGYNSSFHATGVVAHADASANGWNCEWVFIQPANVATVANVYNARLALYNMYLKAYAEGANTSEAEAVYNNASATAEQLNAATEALRQTRYDYALAVASNEDPRDITEFVLTNADFSAGNINGWETNYVSGQQANNIGYQGASYTNETVTISQFIEAWKPGATLGDGYLRQTVQGLPEGKFVLGADAIATWQNDDTRVITGAQLYITADGVVYKTDMSTRNGKPQHFTTEFLNSGAGDVIFGLRTVSANCNWLCADNFTVTFYGIDLSPYAAILADAVAEAQAVGEATIPSAVYSALQSVINTNNQEWSSSSEYTAAISAIQTATSNAVTLQAIYSRYTSLKAAALAIAENTDFTSVDAEVSAATTAEAIEAAIVNLRAAFLAELPNVEIPNDPGYIDVTSVMVDNASVRQSTNFWTIYNYQGYPNTSYSNGVVNYEETEFYQQQFKFYQTLALTPGTWEFGVTGFHRAGNHSTYFYAGDDRILIPGVASDVVNNMAAAKAYFDAGNGKVSLKFLIEAAGNVEIGINNQDTETDRWTIFRDFTLKYYGAPDYTVYENQWADLVAEANTAKTTYANVTGTELTALNEAIADSPAGSNLKATYNAKITALQNALGTFNAAAPSYNSWVLAKNKTTALWGSALGVADPTTAAEAAAGVNALNVAQYNKVADDYTYSMTFKIGDFSTWDKTAKYTDGEGEHDDTPQTNSNQHWSATTREYYEQGSQGWGASNGFNCTYTKTATLPAGNYVLKVAARASGGVTGTLSSTASANTVALPNVNASSKGIDKSGAANFGDGEFANEGIGFGWEWRFLPFNVAEAGEVTITITETTTAQYNWFSLADAELFSDADKAASVELDEYGDFATPISSNDGELANVTLTRRIKEGFNTVCLPFDMTADQVEDLFGTDSKVYAFSDEGVDADNVTVNFETVGAGTITANTPVLVKATKATEEGESNVINGVIIKDSAEPKVEGTYFDFVGTYEAGDVAAGDYYIGGGKLYKSAGTTEIWPSRAYLKAKAAVEVKMFIDDMETSINSIMDVPAAYAPIYTLAGQRVSKAVKGLYIVNGKKVVIK